MRDDHHVVIKDSMMKHYAFSLLCLLLMSAPLTAADKPNIVFLLADDMNRDTWGVYGGKDCKTPNIDKLATEGMTFNRAYCSVAMCAPFRQELYSGRSPWRTGTLANHSKSHPDTKSIPHYLKPLGYRTALLGKTHVGPASAYPFEYLKSGKTNDDFVATATKFIDECKNAQTPFCLFIASGDGHAPFTTGDPSQYDASKLTIPPYWIDTPELRSVLVKYYAEITNFDALIGRMRGVLETKGLWKNTIFVACSEQGVQFPFAKWTCYDNGLHTGIVMHWPGVIKPGSEANELISTQDITPTFVEAAGGDLKDIDVDGKSFLKTLHGEKQVLHEYVYGAFTNCNIIDNRDRIYPIRVIRNKDFSLLYNPNHTAFTSNLTLTKAMSMFHKVDVKSTRKEPDAHPATSWAILQQKNPNDPRLKEIVHKLNKRPEYELYHLGKDPYELKNEIDNPEYQGVVQKMKKTLNSRLKALGDTDPIATEKNLVKAPKKKQPKGKKKKKKQA